MHLMHPPPHRCSHFFKCHKIPREATERVTLTSWLLNTILANCLRQERNSSLIFFLKEGYTKGYCRSNQQKNILQKEEVSSYLRLPAVRAHIKFTLCQENKSVSLCPWYSPSVLCLSICPISVTELTCWVVTIFSCCSEWERSKGAV